MKALATNAIVDAGWAATLALTGYVILRDPTPGIVPRLVAFWALGLVFNRPAARVAASVYVWWAMRRVDRAKARLGE